MARWEKHIKSFGMPCRIMGRLNENGRLGTWGVNGLIVTWSNLVVTVKDRSQMSIISWFPLGVHWFGWVGCIFDSFCNWITNSCQKKYKKICTLQNKLLMKKKLEEFMIKTYWILEKHYGHLRCMFVCMQLKCIYNNIFVKHLVLVSANCIIGLQ